VRALARNGNAAFVWLPDNRHLIPESAAVVVSLRMAEVVAAVSQAAEGISTE
jgi:hypothetical protein